MLQGHSFGLASAAGPRGPELDYDVRDEDGARYRAIPRSGGGTETTWEQEDLFTPAMASKPIRLTVRIKKIRVRRHTTSGELPSKVWPGPWEFTVDVPHRT